jgi:pimeloyl-ACP methyl ester carboxylesterase
MTRVAQSQARLAAAVAAFALGLAGCGQGDAPQRSLSLVDCRLPKLPLSAQCGTLELPENRAKPEGRKVSLAVAVLPANTLNPRADPLFILAGGPGQAASFLGPFAAALTGVRKDRDIVLVDQRGTGRSSPLTCAAFKPDDSADAALELDQVPKARACAKELAEAGVDAAQYTTAAWIADLEAVRSALGYAKINLWGGSYGTRAALEYLRAHPARVRSVVLDGVAAPSMKVFLDVWPSRDIALTAVLDACAQSAPCRAAHPDLPGTLDGIRDRLGPKGRDVEVTNPRTGAEETQHLTFDHVLGAAATHLFARALRAAARGDRQRGGRRLRSPLRRSDARHRGSRPADEQRVALRGDVHRGRASRLDGGCRECAREGALEIARDAGSRRLRCVAEGRGRGRRRESGRERRSRADPLRRARSCHAACERRRGGEDARPQPAHRRARVRAHRFAARVRAAIDRCVHR